MSEWQIDLGNPYHAEHPKNRNRVAMWLPLPNTNGSQTLFDIVPTGHYHQSLTNGPTWTTGANGLPAVNYDGSDDYCGGGWRDLATVLPCTILAYICRTGAPSVFTGIVFGRGSGSNVNGLSFDNSAGTRIGCTWNNTAATYNGFSAGPLTTIGAWGLAAAVITSADATTYLFDDTGAQSKVVTTVSTAATLQSIEVGRDSFGTRKFPGKIGMASIFANRALSLAELYDEYHDVQNGYKGGNTPLRCYRSRTYFLPTSPPPASIGVIGGGVGAAGCVIGA